MISLPISISQSKFYPNQKIERVTDSESVTYLFMGTPYASSRRFLESSALQSGANGTVLAKISSAEGKCATVGIVKKYFRTTKTPADMDIQNRIKTVVDSLEEKRPGISQRVIVALPINEKKAVMPYVDGMSLSDHKGDFILDKGKFKNLCLDLEFLYESGICFSDLSLRNIMKNTHGEFVLIDSDCWTFNPYQTQASRKEAFQLIAECALNHAELEQMIKPEYLVKQNFYPEIFMNMETVLNALQTNSISSLEEIFLL